MFRLNIYTVLFFSIFIISDEDLINEKITTILPPGTNIESIEFSEFPGIFKVYYGDLQPLYVSQNGDFFIYGDMFEITSNQILNLTDIEISSKRKELLSDLDSSKPT